MLTPLLAARRMRQVDLARSAGFAPETLSRLMSSPSQRPHRRNVIAMLAALNRAGPLGEPDALRILEALGQPATLYDEMVRADVERVGRDLQSAGESAHWWEAEAIVRQLIRELGGAEVVATLRGMLAVAQRRPDQHRAPPPPPARDERAGGVIDASGRKIYTVVSPPRRVGDHVEQVFVDYEHVKPRPPAEAPPAARKPRRKSS